MGYEILHVVPETREVPTDLKVHGLTLENGFLRVTVDAKTGCITSFYDKKSNFESIASGGCGNQLIAFKDTPKDYDAWNIDADFEKALTKLDLADSVELTEKGPVRATIRVRGLGKTRNSFKISHFMLGLTVWMWAMKSTGMRPHPA